MSVERHTMTVTIDDGHLSVTVNCPYDLADETRPCWAADEVADDDGNYPPLPAPQPCNYQDWAENLAPEELLSDSWEVTVETEWEWDGDVPRVMFGKVVGDVG